jgi:hypothetical protein
VNVQRQHVLIPGTRVTFKRRLDWFASLPPERWDTIPHAAKRERQRVDGAWSGGLESRLNRCRAVVPGPGFGEGHREVERSSFGWWHGRRGIIAAVTEKLPQGRYLVLARFQAESPGSWSRSAHHFDPSIPEEVENEGDWELLYNDLADPAGTLEAIVTGRSIIAEYTPELLERWDEEARAREAYWRQTSEEIARRFHEKKAGTLAVGEAEGILRDVNREPDDTWHALA